MCMNTGPISVSNISTSPAGSWPNTSRYRAAACDLSARILWSGERTATWSRRRPTSNVRPYRSAMWLKSLAVACSDSNESERGAWSWNCTHFSGFSSAAANVRRMQAVVRPEPRSGSSACCCRSVARRFCSSYSDQRDAVDSSAVLSGFGMRDTLIPFGSLQLTKELSVQMPLDTRCRQRRRTSVSCSKTSSTDFCTGLCPTIAASDFVEARSSRSASTFFLAFFAMTHSLL